jgi:hypothetical protein
MKLKASLMSALSLLVACGGGGDGPPVGRSPREPVGLPLIERRVQATYSCQLTQPLTSLGIVPWGGAALTPGKRPLLAWHDQCWDDCDYEADIALASLEDRVLGEPRPLFVGMEMWASVPSMAVNGQRVTAVWEVSGDGLQEDARLMLAQLTQAGEVLTPPHALPLTEAPRSFAIAASGPGYGLVWIEPGEVVHDEQTALLKFQRLDEDGEPIGATALVLETTSWAWITDLVAVGDGFAVVLGQSSAEVEVNRTMRYLGIDGEGRPYWGPAPFADWDVALLRRGRRVLAAWTHTLGAGLGTSIRIGWFGERGQPEGDTVELRAPTFYEDHSDPAWVELGDDVGLVWSRGFLTGSCWGCVEDDHLEFIVLDGESLEPKSELVTVEWPQGAYSLAESMLAADGGEVTIVTNIATHRELEGAIAGVSCR